MGDANLNTKKNWRLNLKARKMEKLVYYGETRASCP